MTGREQLDSLSQTLRTRGWVEIIKPAAEKRIERLMNEWLSGARSDDTKGLSEEGIKQQILAVRWLLGWENILSEAMRRMAEMEQMEADTEPATEGGSPLA